ncbi:hypothetical protein RDI58_014989 [Solanum bulbocastanum]|uniref:Uncharacterized protein n=1 Tax=Solanum bulbocastanum TaxID=147425 RepID=A0AAN8TEF8_SOLBU
MAGKPLNCFFLKIKVPLLPTFSPYNKENSRFCQNCSCKENSHLLQIKPSPSNLGRRGLIPSEQQYQASINDVHDKVFRCYYMKFTNFTCRRFWRK